MAVANQFAAVNNITGAGIESVAADGSLTTKPLSSLRILATMDKHPTCCSAHLLELKINIFMELTTLIMDLETIVNLC